MTETIKLWRARARLAMAKLELAVIRKAALRVQTLRAVEAEVADEPVEGVRLSREEVTFLVSHPCLASRRLKFDAPDLIGLIQRSLVQQGMPAQVATSARFIWVGTKGGAPELYVILPGHQA